jgi:hypothetical protein
VSPQRTPASWLFIRRNETVRVFRPGPPYLQLAIAGPKGHRRTLRFDREEELQEFQRDHEQQLMKDGWHLEGTDVERRSGRDRRRMARGSERRSEVSVPEET